jgi:hypothetical protein
VCGNGSRRREHYASSEIAKRVFPGECTVIPGLWFAYGHDAIVAAIGRNLPDKSDKKDKWQAISYRFLRDDKGWRVLVSVSLPEVKHSSDKRLG